MTYVLDTNIITALLKDNEKVKQKSKKAIEDGKNILINGISYYEVKRGLLAINAPKKLMQFETLCREFGLIFLDTQDIFEMAADIYVQLQKKGQLVGDEITGDADILIASIVKCKKFILVSDNTKHFNRIGGLLLENWLT